MVQHYTKNNGQSELLGCYLAYWIHKATGKCFRSFLCKIWLLQKLNHALRNRKKGRLESKYFIHYSNESFSGLLQMLASHFTFYNNLTCPSWWWLIWASWKCTNWYKICIFCKMKTRLFKINSRWFHIRLLNWNDTAE